jgi:hypothetical protein
MYFFAASPSGKPIDEQFALIAIRIFVVEGDGRPVIHAMHGFDAQIAQTLVIVEQIKNVVDAKRNVREPQRTAFRARLPALEADDREATVLVIIGDGPEVRELFRHHFRVKYPAVPLPDSRHIGRHQADVGKLDGPNLPLLLHHRGSLPVGISSIQSKGRLPPISPGKELLARQ